MHAIDIDELRDCLAKAIEPGNSTYIRGHAFEDAIEVVFTAVPGCDVQRNSLNRFASEEVDLSVMNFKDPGGLRALPDIFLVECKDWSVPVNAATVSTFALKIRHRGCTLGILVAANGVTGNPHERTAAFQSAALALAEGTKILLMTTADLHTITCATDVVDLLHRRLLDLVAAGTFTLA